MAQVEQLTEDARSFMSERHLATLSTMARDGTIHAVPVGFTFADGVARVITSGSSQKVLNIQRSADATLCQVDGARWLTIVGTGKVLDDAESVRDAEARYATRYRTPRPNPARVTIILRVTKVMGSRGMISVSATG